VFLRVIRKVLLIALLGGLLTATLVRLAPGYGLSEEQLDMRRNAGSLHAAESMRAGERNVFRYYAAFLVNYAKGDLGESTLFQRPVRGLVAERIAPTAASLALGLAGGWIFALLFGIPGAMRPWPALEGLTRTAAILLQCIPAVVVGLLMLTAGARGAQACAAAIALVLYPRLVQYVMNLVREASLMPHVLTARAKGVGGRAILFRHVLPVVFPQLLALAGVSVSMALSVAIPIEMILDVAGLGQLTWQAALGRDMNLLVNLTVLIAVAISLSNALADWIAVRWRTGEAREP
jgi:peptide/nickel transport system permease protein